MSTDIFCKVIDNYGDIGVCWRLCKQLATLGETVRLIVDDASALTWMESNSDQPLPVEVISWQDAEEIESPADLVIESFGCELPEIYIAKMALQAKWNKASKPSIWINLEYLTAERYAEQCHLLPSPVMHGAGKGLTKTFFYPGFTGKTGGLLRESDLFERQAEFDKEQWLKSQSIQWSNERIVSLFCYEPSALPALLEELQNGGQPTLLLVTAGRASQAVQVLQTNNALEALSNKALRIHYLPFLTQDDYDHLLWASDFNFVRGEDSLVRAIWAGKPFVWQIYPQDDDAHHAKLTAFLDVYLANVDASIASHIRGVHLAWNSVSKNVPAGHMDIDFPAWRPASLTQRGLWANLPNLASQLLAS
jgi:uncharacterized repeat protein (TIGR03837 family)